MQNIVDKETTYRGSERLQINLSLIVKQYIIIAILYLSFFLVFALSYLSYEMLSFVTLDYNEYAFNWQHFFISIAAGGILSLIFGKKIANLYSSGAKELNEKLINDEYVRGAKLVSVEEFNDQYQGEADFIEFDVKGTL